MIVKLLGKSFAQLIVEEVEEASPSISVQLGAKWRATMVCQSIRTVPNDDLLAVFCCLACTCS